MFMPLYMHFRKYCKVFFFSLPFHGVFNRMWDLDNFTKEEKKFFDHLQVLYWLMEGYCINNDVTVSAIFFIFSLSWHF